MKHFLKLLLITILFPVLSFSQETYTINGVVIDGDNKEELPIVNISINGNAFRGAHTDPRGKFSIKLEKGKDKFLLFKYIGFKPKKVFVNPSMSGKFIEVEIEPEKLEIEEVVVSAKWNPAFYIMKKAAQFAEKHNPDNLQFYKSRIYNKFKIKLDADSSIYDESIFGGFYEVFGDYYMYVSESVTDRYYQNPNDLKNIIYINKAAGYELPQFNFNFENIRPFHFYDDFIQLYNKRYLNPLSEGSANGYYFSLQDTVDIKGRASYKIKFFPEKLTNFNALEGNIYIDSSSFAITKVQAEPKIKEIIDVKIEQEYKLFNDSIWFPSLLKSQLYWPEFPTPDANIIVYSETYPANLILNPVEDSVEFDEFAFELQLDKYKKDTNFLLNSRVQKLSLQEEQSYKHIDSISKEYHVEEITNAVGSIITEFTLPLGYADIDVSKLYYYDNYQSHRFGFGLKTSDILFKNFQIGGYATWGTKDEKWKRGVDLTLKFDEIIDYDISFSFKDDIEQPTTNYLIFDRRFDIIRDIIVDRYNNLEEYKLSFGQRLKYFKYKFSFKNQIVEPHYFLENNYSEVFQKFTEFEINMKYANKEKVMPLFGEEMILNTDEPKYYFKYQQGLKDFWDGEYEYYRFAASVNQNFSLFRYGILKTHIEAGHIEGDGVPYHKLFSGNGSNHEYFTFFLMNTFPTMYQYEFTNSSYVNIFLRNTFEPFTFGNEYFKPTISISQNIGFGWAKDNILAQKIVDDHNNPKAKEYEVMKDMHKGYFETGISISNIARMRLLSFGYFGLGVHAFYRWGPYSFDDNWDNVSIRFGFAYSL